MKKERAVKVLINNKPRLILRLLVSILVLILVILALVVLAFIFHKPITGYIIINNGDYTGTGYAVPQGFTINPEYFTLSSSNQIFNISIDVNNIGGFVYQIGYFYNAKINEWVPFTFPQSTISGSNWISEHASTVLTLNASDNLQEGYNYIAVYSCKKSGADWVCGCESTKSGAACNLWMLQIFNTTNIVNSVVNVTNISSTTCAWDYDCGSGKICVNRTCILKPCTLDSDCLNGTKCSTNGCIAESVQDYINLTNCSRINVANRIYVLQNNLLSLGNCLNLSAKNTTLDLNNYAVISSGASNAPGVYIQNSNNLTLKNLRVSLFDKGLVIENSKAVTLDSLALINNSLGLLVMNSDMTKVYNGSIINNSQIGVRLINASNFQFASYSYVLNNGYANATSGYGVYLTDASGLCGPFAASGNRVQDLICLGAGSIFRLGGSSINSVTNGNGCTMAFGGC